MFDNTPQSRRDFLRRSGQLALSGTALPFAMNLAALGEAAAFNAPGDYKALVCVFMNGGNDYGNTLVPYDLANYDEYHRIRSGGNTSRDPVGLALGFNALAPTALSPAVDPQDLMGVTRRYALHPAMPEMASLFAAGKMAVQLNVGTMVRPITRAEYDANSGTPKARPPQLFSHNDQQNQWQSQSGEGAKYGWGGLSGDEVIKNGTINTGGSALFTCIAVRRGGVLVSGDRAQQFLVNSSGPVTISPTTSPYGSADVGTVIRNLCRSSSNVHKFENEYNAVTVRALDAVTSVNAALASVPVSTFAANPFVGNDLGPQLQMVARLIKGRASLGNPKRQVFFVSFGGFDAHNGLLNQHTRDLADLSKNLKAFYEATKSEENQITAFTASDFGRTLAINEDGSDHGWGGHHFVVGGAVNGNAYYGKAPPVSVDNVKVAGAYVAKDQWHVGSGSLLPTTSVDQYAGTLAKWFGVSDTELDTIFPNLNNFVGLKNGINYTKDLGFMKP